MLKKKQKEQMCSFFCKRKSSLFIYLFIFKLLIMMYTYKRSWSFLLLILFSIEAICPKKQIGS